jgi:hypothetical protein
MATFTETVVISGKGNVLPVPSFVPPQPIFDAPANTLTQNQRDLAMLMSQLLSGSSPDKFAIDKAFECAKRIIEVVKERV